MKGALDLSFGNEWHLGKRTLICSGLPLERDMFQGAESLTIFDARPLDWADFQMDIQNMERIPSGSVDLFVAIHVLNHVADDGQALAEIDRILSPQGAALLTVGIRDDQPTQAIEDRTTDYGAEALAKWAVGTYRRYGFADFQTQLSKRFWVRSHRHLEISHGERRREYAFVARPMR